MNLSATARLGVSLALLSRRELLKLSDAYVNVAKLSDGTLMDRVYDAMLFAFFDKANQSRTELRAGDFKAYEAEVSVCCPILLANGGR